MPATRSANELIAVVRAMVAGKSFAQLEELAHSLDADALYLAPPDGAADDIRHGSHFVIRHAGCRWLEGHQARAIPLFEAALARVATTTRSTSSTCCSRAAASATPSKYAAYDGLQRLAEPVRRDPA